MNKKLKDEKRLFILVIIVLIFFNLPMVLSTENINNYEYQKGEIEISLEIEGGSFLDEEGNNKPVLKVDEGATPKIKFESNGHEVTVLLRDVDIGAKVELDKINHRLIIEKNGKKYRIPLTNIPEKFNDIKFQTPENVEGYAVMYSTLGEGSNKIALQRGVLQTDDEGKLNIEEDDYFLGEVTFSKNAKNARYLRGKPKSITKNGKTTDYEDGDYVWGKNKDDVKFSSGVLTIKPSLNDDLAYGEDKNDLGRRTAFAILGNYGGVDDGNERVYTAMRGLIERGTIDAEILNQNDVSIEFETNSEGGEKTIVLTNSGEGEKTAIVGSGIVNTKFKYDGETLKVYGSGLTGETQIYSSENGNAIWIKKGSISVKRISGGEYRLNNYVMDQSKLKTGSDLPSNLNGLPNSEGKVYYDDQTKRFYAYRDGDLYLGKSVNTDNPDCPTCPVNFNKVDQKPQKTIRSEESKYKLIQVNPRVSNDVSLNLGGIIYKALNEQQSFEILNGYLKDRVNGGRDLDKGDVMDGIQTFTGGRRELPGKGVRIFSLQDRYIKEFGYCDTCTRGLADKVGKSVDEVEPQYMWRTIKQLPKNN